MDEKRVILLWLGRFDERTLRLLQNSVLLLIDICRAHGGTHCIFGLQNVELLLFSLNPTNVFYSN